MPLALDIFISLLENYFLHCFSFFNMEQISYFAECELSILEHTN